MMGTSVAFNADNIAVISLAACMMTAGLDAVATKHRSDMQTTSMLVGLLELIRLPETGISSCRNYGFVMSRPTLNNALFRPEWCKHSADLARAMSEEGLRNCNSGSVYMLELRLTILLARHIQ